MVVTLINNLSTPKKEHYNDDKTSIQLVCLYYMTLFQIDFTFSFLCTWLVTNVIWTLLVYLAHRFIFDIHLKHVSRVNLYHIQMRNIRFETMMFNAWYLVKVAGTLIICSCLRSQNHTTRNILTCLTMHYVHYELCRLIVRTYKHTSNSKFIGFHNTHDSSSDINFGCGTPAWDIVFGTIHDDYRLNIFSYIPIQMISFL
jgi:hypothetical protein